MKGYSPLARTSIHPEPCIFFVIVLATNPDAIPFATDRRVIGPPSPPVVLRGLAIVEPDVAPRVEILQTHVEVVEETVQLHRPVRLELALDAVLRLDAAFGQPGHDDVVR